MESMTRQPVAGSPLAASPAAQMPGPQQALQQQQQPLSSSPQVLVSTPAAVVVGEAATRAPAPLAPAQPSGPPRLIAAWCASHHLRQTYLQQVRQAACTAGGAAVSCFSGNAPPAWTCVLLTMPAACCCTLHTCALDMPAAWCCTLYQHLLWPGRFILPAVLTQDALCSLCSTSAECCTAASGESFHSGRA